MDLVKLLTNDFNFSELSEIFNPTNTVVNKLDFTKKEDLDKLNEFVQSVKELNETSTDNWLGNIAKLFVTDELLSTLDTILDEANKTYNEAHNTKKVIDKSTVKVETETVPVRPSKEVPETVKTQIGNLVVNYLSEKIIPNGNFTSEQLKSIGDGLQEFACWVYTR